MSKFPLIDLQGSPKEIGSMHGELLKDRITRSINFYTDVTKKLDDRGRRENEAQILEYAKKFKKKIKKFNSAYSQEIEAIAEAADADPLWIYALNSRSEIMTNMQEGSTECTAIYFKNKSLLGQNWDWSKDFEELAVLMRIKLPNGHTILQMTEPGIIGKIGMNNKGLGVCLNFLNTQDRLDGVPIHVVLRAILECSTITEVQKVIKKAGKGRAGNILFADKEGNFGDVEFSGKKVSSSYPDNDFYVHTNHFIANDKLNFNRDDLQSSFTRYETANKLIKEIKMQSIQLMKSTLLNKSNPELPICRNYAQGTIMEDVGTVCTIIMELDKDQLQITRGSPYENDFEVFSV